MLTRLAVATVFVCIVILLASACGWAPSYNGPSIAPQEFVLYQTTPGDPPRIIGYGSMGGRLATIYTTINLVETSCPGGRPSQVQAQGQVDSGLASLHSSPNQPVDLALSGTVHSLPHDELALDLPFTGTLTPLAACAGTGTIHIEARPGPDLHYRWQGRFSDITAPFSIVLNLSQVRPKDRTAGTLWGKLLVTIGQCPRLGSFYQPLNASASSTTRTFLMDDNSLLTVTGLPANLDPEPPASLNVTLTFSGGPCDNRSFTATLNK